jgi:hypothetical protein
MKNPAFRTRKAAVFFLTTLLPACGARSLPTAPSELTTGIVIYEHADFTGESALITEDVKNLEDFKGPCIKGSDDSEEESWTDCISSIRVAPGWRATLYRDDGFQSDSLLVTMDTANLARVAGRCPKGGFNDCVSSIRLRRD